MPVDDACVRHLYEAKLRGGGPIEGWWECHRCGSLWTGAMMGEWWRPLSCSERNLET
jgi:hypothetical protein